MATAGGTGWTTSLGLMAGIRANEPAAWERFTQLYGALFDRWFYLAGVPTGEWADIRQEVFLAVAQGLPGYAHAPGRGAFRGWLRVVVRNKVADYRRARVPPPDPRAHNDRPAPDPLDEETAGEHGLLLLRRALDLLRTDFESATWRAFWLAAVEDRAAADVAADLGMTVNAVYLARGRILRRLREEFAGLLDDPPG
jgi:RNA polymerase sigma-70 factor (ECF subfamily)